MPELTYYETISALAMKGCYNTCIEIIKDKVNEGNIDIAVQEFESFCKRREEEYSENYSGKETVKMVYNKLKYIQGNKKD